MFDLVIKNNAGISYVNKIPIHVVMYGVKGYHNYVAWDELYQSNNTGITFNAPIEVQDALIHKIQSLKKSTILLLIVFLIIVVT